MSKRLIVIEPTDPRRSEVRVLVAELDAYMLRLYGAEARAAFFVHTPSQESLVLEDVDTIIINYPGEPENGLLATLAERGIAFHLVGDALAPRTAEEAVFEGLKAAVSL